MRLSTAIVRLLKELIETLGGGGTKALNEPSHVECGAPDFIVEHSGVPIGYVECKDVGVNLDNAERSDQLKRYRGGLPNLILTDYLEFRWYVRGRVPGVGATRALERSKAGSRSTGQARKRSLRYGTRSSRPIPRPSTAPATLPNAWRQRLVSCVTE